MCPVTYGAGTPNGNCNENQFSDPFVGPDGALYVAYNNYNNAVSGNDNRNQILLAKSTDGGNTFSTPVQGQRLLRPARLRHLPGRRRRFVPGLRAGEGIVDGLGLPRDELRVGRRQPEEPEPGRGDVRLVHQQGLERVERLRPGRLRLQHRDQHSTPASRRRGRATTTSSSASRTTAVRASPERRPTRASEATVNQDPGQATTDQFWQWASFTKDGKLAVDYYDRQYGIGRDDGLRRTSRCPAARTS